MHKSTLLILAAFLFFSLHTNKSFATHAMGGELNYTWISGNTYEFTYIFYRDCMGISAPTQVDLVANSVSCNVDSATSILYLLSSSQIASTCNGALTYCNGGTNFGYESYTYQGQVTLPFACDDWEFSVSVAARNNAITNLTDPGTTELYVSASLDNLNTPFNNAPIFTNAPVAIEFVNQTYHFNNGAIDPDGDSLVFSLSNALTGGGAPISYVFPYSYSNPMSSSTPIILDEVSGDFIVTPDQIQVAVVTFTVKEYRNNILIGSSTRDIQLIVQTGTDQLPVLSGIDNTASYLTSVAADSTLQFTIYSDDADAGQTLHISWSGTVGDVTIDSSGVFPTATFSWTPTVSDVQPYPYIITFTVSDDACPYKGIQIFSYQVYVNQGNSGDVWPGDANDDYTVDLYDILPIGIAFGETGPVRSGASLNWIAQYCTDWSNSFNSGVNYKHADCDGSGLVDNADFDVVTLNYGQFHLKPTYDQDLSTREGAPLFLDFSSATIDEGTNVDVPIHLGSSQQTVTGVYGIVFQLQFDPSLIQSASMSFDANTSWLGTNQNMKLVTIDESADGAFNIGLVRLNQANVDGDGQIGTLHFTTANAIDGEYLSFNFSNVFMTDIAGTELLVVPQEDSILIAATTGIATSSTEAETISIFPNPSDGNITLKANHPSAGQAKVQIIDNYGRVVFETDRYLNSSEQLNLSHLANGQYQCWVIGEKNAEVHKLLIAK